MLFDISKVLVDNQTGELKGYIIENVNNPMYKVGVSPERLKVIDPDLYEMASKRDVEIEEVCMYENRYALLSREKLFLPNYSELPLERLETGDFVVYGHVIPEQDFCNLDDTTAIRRAIKGYEY